VAGIPTRASRRNFRTASCSFDAGMASSHSLGEGYVHESSHHSNRSSARLGRPARSEAARDGVTRFQHRRKISSILIRNTVVPTAVRTTSGSCLATEGVKSPKTRSCYEYHPPGLSKTVRTAVGRSIFPAGGTGHISKAGAGKGEPADRGAHQSRKKTRRVRSAGLRSVPAV